MKDLIKKMNFIKPSLPKISTASIPHNNVFIKSIKNKKRSMLFEKKEKMNFCKRKNEGKKFMNTLKIKEEREYFFQKMRKIFMRN